MAKHDGPVCLCRHLYSQHKTAVPHRHHRIPGDDATTEHYHCLAYRCFCRTFYEDTTLVTRIKRKLGLQ